LDSPIRVVASDVVDWMLFIIALLETLAIAPFHIFPANVCLSWRHLFVVAMLSQVNENVMERNVVVALEPSMNEQQSLEARG